MQKTIHFWNLESHRDKTAFILADGKRMSYLEVAEATDGLSQAVESGKKLIWIDVQNNVESILGYLMAFRANHAVMMVPAGMDPQQRSVLINKYCPDYLWSVKDRESQDYVAQWGSYALVAGPVKNKDEINPKLNLLLSTSGSTGSIKFVRLKGESVQANAESIAAYLQITSDEIAITCLPLHYSYGLSVLNSHLLSGASIVVTAASFVQKDFWELFRKNGVTSLAGVPYSYEILKKIGFAGMELPSLRYMTQAGGKLSKEYIREFYDLACKWKIKFVVMYGQTEATARISYLPFEALPGKIGSIGKAIPGGTLWLEDANGNRISQSNTDGVMIYEGPNAMMGYALCRSDLMKKDELSGVLRTGDIARFDDDGFFYLTGRENRFVKILGNRVNLDDIENHLRAHAVECLCGGHDEKLKIAIKGAHDIKEIEKLIIDRYKFPKFLFSIRNVDEFMQTASGKPDYAGTFANHP